MPGAFHYNLATTKKGSAFQGASQGIAYNLHTAPPINPTPGDLWFDSANGGLLIYINDGASSQWIEIGNNGVSNPVGTIIPFAGASSPSGFLLCDGTSVSSSNYLALHSVISNTYGGSAYTGAAGLSFNLPDYRGRTLIGAGTGSGLTARTLGGTVGTETVTLDSTQIPAHTHPNTVSGGSTGTMSANASHTHTGFSGPLLKYVGTGGNRTDLTGGSVWIGTDSSPTTVNSQNTDHTHTFTPSITNANNTGGGGSHSNMQPSIGINYLIKT
jgi:microcystin-dependent protein